jgi:hypothetical protein
MAEVYHGHGIRLAPYPKSRCFGSIRIPGQHLSTALTEVAGGDKFPVGQHRHIPHMPLCADFLWLSRRPGRVPHQNHTTGRCAG